MNTSALLNIIGLIFDMVGALLVAWEVVQQYNGSKIAPFKTGEMLVDAKEQEGLVSEHPLYKQYEARRYRNMKWGLACLAIGFIFQIVANFLQLCNP
jgi:hypothetical protein